MHFYDSSGVTRYSPWRCALVQLFFELEKKKKKATTTAAALHTPELAN